jgi:hypothetical protein
MKINTTTLLLIGVALVGVYLITKPKPLPVPVYNPYLAPGAYGSPQGSTVAQDITASGQAASGLGDLISNLFG